LKTKLFIKLSGLLLLAMLWSCNTGEQSREDAQIPEDPLPSWNDSKSRKAILSFVEDATDASGQFFIPADERIAVFDNDGTLWAEQPMYFQLYFIMDRIKKLAPEHPEWREEQPYKAVLENDMEKIKESGVEGLLTMAMAAQGGLPVEEFEAEVKTWIDTAKHPLTGNKFKDMVYLPMLELLDYLRANGFKTYIVSGGGIDFMRPWTEEVYGIPPEQVVGSMLKYKLEMRDGKPEVVKIPEIGFIDDKEGKPVGIWKFIGKRPVAAFGNSDGDLQMLQWTDAGSGRQLLVYIHHTDSIREWAYGRESHIGKLDKGLDEALKKEWTVVDMAEDWRAIYPVTN